MNAMTPPSAAGSEPALHPCCAASGSENIVADARACWNPEDRCWTLDAVYDRAECWQPGATTSLDWAPTTPGQA